MHVVPQIAFLGGLEGQPNTRPGHMGLFVLVDQGLELLRTQPAYRVPVQRMCKLLGQCVYNLHSFRPHDFQYLLPAPSQCRRVMELVHTSYNTIIQSGAQQSGRMQESLSQLYNMLNIHSQTQQGEVSDGSQCEQSPGGSAEDE